MNTILYSWDSMSECFDNDWLMLNNAYQHTIVPMSSKSDYIFCIFRGNIFNGYTINNMVVRPVVYLDSKVRIKSENDGMSEKPFILKNF